MASSNTSNPNPKPNPYHIDLNNVKGDGGKMVEVMKKTTELLSLISEMKTTTNYAIQTSKDQPQFAMEYLEKIQHETKSFRTSLNKWIQKNNVTEEQHEWLDKIWQLLKNGTVDELLEHRKAIESAFYSFGYFFPYQLGASPSRERLLHEAKHCKHSSDVKCAACTAAMGRDGLLSLMGRSFYSALEESEKRRKFREEQEAITLDHDWPREREVYLEDFFVLGPAEEETPK